MPEGADSSAAPAPIPPDRLVRRLDLLRGRTVAVVGNARSILDGRNGALIDSHEVVIRMNRALPEAPESQGRRTDVLVFSTFPPVRDIHAEFGAATFVWMSPKKRDLIAGEGAPPDGTLFYDEDAWAALNARLGARPSVGAMTLDLVAASAPAGVMVFGFDFKRTPTLYLAEDHRGPHDYAAEERYCAELVAANGWSFAGKV